jgi:hypothetical protein
MAEPVRHRQTKEAATDMFDLQPPRHIPTLRVPPVAVRPGEGPLTEPTAGAHARELVFMPPKPTLTLIIDKPGSAHSLDRNHPRDSE